MRAPPRRLSWTRLAGALPALAAGTLLWGWTHGPQPDAATAVRPVSEAGNSRPLVLRYDGLMVRRCEAVTVTVAPGADARAVRVLLHAAGDRAGLPLLDLSPGVLPAASLDVTVPDIVACLPQSASAADADLLLPQPLPGEQRHSVQAVLVHDLAFAVRPERGTPADAASAIDREGSLADTLGHYDVVSGTAGELQVLYTGQLLGDDEVDSVRAAVARAADMPVPSVTVLPRSPLGTGVDLRTEPVPASDAATAPAVHHH